MLRVDGAQAAAGGRIVLGCNPTARHGAKVITRFGRRGAMSDENVVGTLVDAILTTGDRQEPVNRIVRSETV